MIPAVRLLFDLLHRQGILYCHWKSNAALGRAVSAEDDLDLLFEGGQEEVVGQVLKSAGFVECCTVEFRKTVGIQDYLGFDEDSGRLIHVQPHFGLIVGEKRLKSYSLPFSHDYLSRRVFDSRYGVYRAHPADEAVVLWIRLTLKARALPFFVFWRRWSLEKEQRQGQGELVWLMDQVSREELSKRSIAWLGVDLAPEMQEGARHGVTAASVDRSWRTLKVDFRGWRRLGLMRQVWEVTRRDAALLGALLLRRVAPGRAGVHRILPHGVVIAIVGVDGSGKSSQSRELVSWLGNKLDCQHVYLGTGKGQGSMLRAPLRGMRKLRRKIIGRSGQEGAGGGMNYCPVGGVAGFLFSAWRFLWGASVRMERTRKLRSAFRARGRGMVVVCDRYPQADWPGVNDGPLLQSPAGSKGRLKKGLSAWEKWLYDKTCDEWAPDIVIRLRASRSTLTGRRPEMDGAWAEEKQRQLLSCDFGGRVVDVDADREFDVVARDVRQIAFRTLRERQERPAMAGQ